MGGDEDQCRLCVNKAANRPTLANALHYPFAVTFPDKHITHLSAHFHDGWSDVCHAWQRPLSCMRLTQKWGRGSPLFGARSRDHRRPYVLKNAMSATCASFTAGVLRRARINDKPAPAETRARVLSILSILMPREKSALLASSNLSRPVRLDLVHRGG